MQYAAKNDTVYFVTLARDPSNNGELIDIVDSSDVWVWEHGTAASGAVISDGATITKLTGTGAPGSGGYLVAIDTSEAAYSEGNVYTVVVEGDIVSGGTAGVTGSVVGEFTLTALMTAADVQAECEDAIQAYGMGLYSTISAVNSQTSIDLDTGPTTDDALNGAEILLRDSNGLIAGFARVTDYDGTNKRLTLNESPYQTITTNHTVSVLPASRGRGLSNLEDLMLRFTVVSATSATSVNVTITDWYGNAVTGTEMSSNALSYKGLIMNSVQGGSGSSKWDSALILGGSYGANWALTLSSTNSLRGTPVAGDEGFITLFG